MAVRLGMIGTSWWVDSMYLPALETLADAEVVAISGRDAERAADRANQWSIPGVFIDWKEMIEQVDLDGLIVAAANPVHYPATKAGLLAGLDVLCEKPVADTYEQAAELADLAQESGAVTMVPFTYAYMPGFRWMEQLIEDGYVGKVLHVGLRYHTGYALGDEYLWKLDADHNPSGALGDIGSHFVHLALRLAGPVSGVTAVLETLGSRAAHNPDGEPYEPAPDSGVVVLEFESGAQGVLHASAVAHEGTSMNQRHEVEVHGTEGHLRYLVDWDTIQVVTGTRVGAGPPQELPMPDEIWGGVRRDTVHNTYRDVFRTTDAMARSWVGAIRDRRLVRPNLRDGAAVQQILDASLVSSAGGVRVELA